MNISRSIYIEVIFKSKSHSLKLFGTNYAYNIFLLRVVLLNVKDSTTRGLIIAFILE